MTSAVTYAANERVLCYHGPLIYEAKVQKVDDGSHAIATELPTLDGPLYFVHYKGWKQSSVSHSLLYQYIFTRY